MVKRALLSVSDKIGMVDFARGLVSLGYEVVSTGGTYQLLVDNEVPATPVEAITQFPEMMDGRLKTLHPMVHGGLLADVDIPSHVNDMTTHGIGAISVVAVNLYPFKATISKPNVTLTEAIENIDIGGPTMLRSAAKNHKHVNVIVDPADYDQVLSHLQAGDTTLEFRRQLAAKVFYHTSAYDSLIGAYLSSDAYPQVITRAYEKVQDLRYGENPHQTAAFYRDSLPGGGIATGKQLHGKELSYNNINDANTAIDMIQEQTNPAAVAVKHANPCGVATADTIETAYQKAYDSDPVSIFGGIVALNRQVGEALASHLSQTFLEIIIAPEFTPEALVILQQKKNIRLIQLDTAPHEARKKAPQLRQVQGGMLIQSPDAATTTDYKLTFPTKRQPSPVELEEALFAQGIVKYVKSNGIVLTKEQATVGIGPGQTNRIGAAEIALKVAGAQAQGAVLASDAFFPMADIIELIRDKGIRVIIQPGGSIRDQEVIDACDTHGIAMIFTGVRHFSH